MSVDEIMALIPDSLKVAVGACVVMGFVLKSIPKMPNWAIPAINCLVVGPVAACVIAGFTEMNALLGMLCGFVSLGAHQFVKQPLDRKN